MKDFRVRKETRKPFAAAGKVSLLALVGGAAVLTGAANNETRTAGVPVPVRTIQSTADAQRLADKEFQSRLQISMQHDVPLTLSSGGRTIRFTADGFDPTNRIAYEWVRAGGYESLPADERLGRQEIDYVTNFTFGDTFIVISGATYDYQLEGQIADFVYYYNNRER